MADDDRPRRRRPEPDDEEERPRRRAREEEDEFEERPRRRAREEDDLDDRPHIVLLSGPSVEKLQRDEIALTNDLAGILETVKDRETAKAAAPRVEALVGRVGGETLLDLSI